MPTKQFYLFLSLKITNLLVLTIPCRSPAVSGGLDIDRKLIKFDKDMVLWYNISNKGCRLLRFRVLSMPL